MLDLEEVTTLLKNNGVNTVAKKLKCKKANIYKLLEENSLVYEDREVKPIDFKNNNITKVITKNKGIEEVAITKVIQKYKQSDNKQSENVIQRNNKSIDINKLNELIDMIEPLKEIIQKHNKSKNIIEVDKVELKPPSVTEVKQKLFKVDIDVLENWNKFIAEHKEFKVQSLISLALLEFIEKYSK